MYFCNPSGRKSGVKVRELMSAGVLGCIVTPRQGQAVPEGATWCADNGCYGKGYPGDDAWWSWLTMYDPTGCAFAVAPDVVADAGATLERSLTWLAEIRDLGIPAAFAAQDGLERLTVPWGEFDVLFIGGSTDWKLGPHARELISEARALGKRVHMGRVNSEKRYRYAARIGCDSADGTCLTWGVEANLPRVRGWLRSVDQGVLDLEAS